MPYDPTPYLDPSSCGLVLFECQEAVIGSQGRIKGLLEDVRERQMIGNLAHLLACARKAGVFVAYCNMAFRPDGLAAPNTPRADNMPRPEGPPPPPGEPSPVVEPLRPLPLEPVFERIHGMSAFYGTPLDTCLRDRGITTFLPTGVSLNIGIPASTVEALNRGFRIVIAQDCVAGDPPSYARDVCKNTLNNLAYLSWARDIAKAWNVPWES
jgi:nicotinamidase-related amidase